MQQLDLVDLPFSIRQDHLDLQLQPSFIEKVEATLLLQHLIETTSWQQPRVKVWGKWHLTPRLICFYGDEPLEYAYSGTLHRAQPWTTRLLELKQRVSEASGQAFNAVLLNYYRNGQDSIGWHADDEKELGARPVIASLSLGTNRDMHFKPKARSSSPVRINLPSGSLLTMRGDTQEYWLHHIPKRARCTTPRINLTFRKIFRP